jgi:hypothetical protein
MASKDLSVAEVQALGEQIAAIKKAAAGLDLRVTVRIEAAKASDVAVVKLNELLSKVSDDLRLT